MVLKRKQLTRLSAADSPNPQTLVIPSSSCSLLPWRSAIILHGDTPNTDWSFPCSVTQEHAAAKCFTSDRKQRRRLESRRIPRTEAMSLKLC